MRGLLHCKLIWSLSTQRLPGGSLAFMLPEAEDTKSEDLRTFLDGFAQGAKATLHLSVACGTNGHHIWEAVFRALGTALGAALAKDASRAGMTSGVAGKITYSCSTGK